MDEPITLNFDGGSRGNPGPAGIGVVLSAADQTPLVTLGRFIGRATNNVAEYKALITGLQEAKKLGVRRLHVRGDSQLVIKQLLGEYRVKHPDMKPLHAEAQSLLAQFDKVAIEHNLRGKNVLADKLANLAMDRRQDVSDIDAPGVPAFALPKAAALAKWMCERCGCEIEIVEPGDPTADRHSPFICRCGQKMSDR